MGACASVPVPRGAPGVGRGIGPTAMRGGGGGMFYHHLSSPAPPRYMYSASPIPASPMRATALPFYPQSPQPYYEGVAKRSPDQVCCVEHHLTWWSCLAFLAGTSRTPCGGGPTPSRHQYPYSHEGHQVLQHGEWEGQVCGCKASIFLIFLQRFARRVTGVVLSTRCTLPPAPQCLGNQIHCSCTKLQLWALG